jgi:hypothetical protein
VDCDRFAEVAAELALGVLTGRERAEAVPQLDRCDACREDVRELAFTGEELLGLLPEVTPPAGLEFRVLNELSVYGSRRRGRRRWPGGSQLMVAAAAAAVLAAGGGLAGWMASGGTSGPALHPATLTTARHQAIGRVFLDNQGDLGNSGWVYVSVDGAAGNGTVVCQLLGRDGRVTTIGSFGLDGGYGYWGSPETMPGTTVAGARLLTEDGRVLAAATFGS